MALNIDIIATISTANTVLALETLLSGIYTLVFAWAIWHSFSKQHKLHSAALLLLWLIAVATLCLDWVWFSGTHRNPDSDLSNTDNSTQVNHTLVILDNILSACSILLGDAILLWRCYMLRERNTHIVISLGTLYFANFVLFFMTFFTQGTPQAYNGPNEQLVTVLIFTSVLFTSLGTAFIGARIMTFTRKSLPGISTIPYREILQVLVESWIIHAVGMLVIACNLINLDLSDDANYTGSPMLGYGEAFLTPLLGLAPTLVSLRVALQIPSTEVHSSLPYSHITFARSILGAGSFSMQYSAEDGPWTTFRSRTNNPQESSNGQELLHSGDTQSIDAEMRENSPSKTSFVPTLGIINEEVELTDPVTGCDFDDIECGIREESRNNTGVAHKKKREMRILHERSHLQNWMH